MKQVHSSYLNCINITIHPGLKEGFLQDFISIHYSLLNPKTCQLK